MSAEKSVIKSALRELAEFRGVGLEYEDGRGVLRSADPDVLMAILNSFGDTDELSNQNDAKAVARQLRQQRTDRIVESVYVVEEGSQSVVPIRLARRGADLECRLEFEFGGEISWTMSPDSLVARPKSDGRDEPVLGLQLPAMRVGYHHLHVTVGRRSVRAIIIARPIRGASHRFSPDWRAFSVQAPVFSLHSQRSWGSGDVGDLDEFARLVANQHATVVSTLPLLATFGPDNFEASPYRPVSRRFWSDRWIALDQVEYLAQSPAALRLMNETYSPRHRQAWTVDGLVDGAAAFAAKRNVIQAWAATQSDFMTQKESGLLSYVMGHPELNDYARFRAAGERFGLDFHQWPSTARSGLLRWNDVDPILVRYHMFAQWIMDGQMTDLSSRLAQRGQTLGLDIPVGVHPYGYDVWKNPEDYVTSMSIGAPPDDLSARGQSWASPPLHPDRCRDDVHSKFREALQFHMRVAGVVRIDHFMGLQRLFWIPEGASPEQGLYVNMPFDELLAVVAVEAQRAGVDVVGEDLGTVHDELRDAMQSNGIRRTYVVQYAVNDEHLDEVPSGSVASFATHDTATFAGWWSGTDIDERLQLGHFDESTAQEARARRATQRRNLISALGCAEDASPDAVLNAVHVFLADSEAGLVMVQLEDLLGESLAVNLPGTSTERANWSRRSRLSLEELASSTTLAKALAPLSERRGYPDAVHDRVGIRMTPSATLFTAEDLHLFNEGRHFRLYDHLGCHPMVVEGVAGCYFAVWAPNADRVSVIGDFNDWHGTQNPLSPRESSGVWEGFVPGAEPLMAYKYRLHSRLGGEEFDKTDPMGRYFEVPSATATRVWRSSHQWDDGVWMAGRSQCNSRERPVTVYEVHLGSWRRVPEEGDRSLSYRELAPLLADYAIEMGFTHVELLPVMEHPFYGSWGYQTTGYFAPTSRMGTPDDFKFLVDHLHQAGIGVILDWVPSHFPSDSFALARFDGSYLYEHADVRQRVHPEWKSWTFNYGRNEVRSFLISSANFWLDEYHVDGLRLDAVASMLYLDYSRGPGQWVPNRLGGREDLDAVEFLRQCTSETTRAFPGVMIVAEESTSWSQVTGPVSGNGLGFTFKWDLGWMHDTLDYLERDSLYRQYHQSELTFRAIYAANEHFMLPLSHDEVVHGKGSLLAKMSGDEWQKRANLRLLFGYQYTIPGKKLLFMGDEFAQTSEWDHERSLDWHLLADAGHRGVASWVRRLNSLYANETALHRDDATGEDFAWLSCDDASQSVLIWRRGSGDEELVMLANFTPVPRDDYEIPVTASSAWAVVANSDDPDFGGSGYLRVREFPASRDGSDRHGLRVVLPPLSLVVLKRKS
jgi:alpha-1,4-glucan:alpha-1,4-glucan 6-glycosyltransferase/4-alpha-glucanotransferase